jgi:hypothetical protein
MSPFQPDLVVAALPSQRAAAVRALLEDVVAERPQPGWRRRFMPTATGAAVALLLAACAGVVAGDHATAPVRPVTNTTRARCYTSASLAPAGGYGFMGTIVTLSNRNGRPVQVTDALSVCAVLWRQGLLRRGIAGLGPRIGSHHPVPPLVVCVMPDGVAAVFPGRAHTCADLGLPRARRRVLITTPPR